MTTVLVDLWNDTSRAPNLTFPPRVQEKMLPPPANVSVRGAADTRGGSPSPGVRTKPVAGAARACDRRGCPAQPRPETWRRLLCLLSPAHWPRVCTCGGPGVCGLRWGKSYVFVFTDLREVSISFGCERGKHGGRIRTGGFATDGNRIFTPHSPSAQGLYFEGVIPRKAHPSGHRKGSMAPRR